MKVNRVYAVAILLAAAVPFYSFQRVLAEPTVAAASPASGAAPTLQEILNKRGAARRELMLNSLRGIRGLGFGAIHTDNTAELEKIMVERLKQLDIPLHPFSALKPGVKPVDALLEIKVSKVPTANYVQVNLFQWVSLIRQPKTEVRAVTYHDSTLCTDADLNKSVEQLTEQFVVDVLKANQQTATVTPEKSPVHKKR
jgi:hypothetical protein